MEIRADIDHLQEMVVYLDKPSSKQVPNTLLDIDWVHPASFMPTVFELRK